jgi:hypothetical protein
MMLEVRFDELTIYKATFPLCRGERGSATSQGQKARTSLSFRLLRNELNCGSEIVPNIPYPGEVLQLIPQNPAV